MDADTNSRRAPTLLAAVAAVFVTTGAVYALWRHDPSVMAEEGLVEWIAAGMLVFSAVVFGVRARSSAHVVDRVTRVGLALFCVSLALREIDIDKLGDRAVMTNVEYVFRGAAVVAWCVFAWWAFPHRDAFWRARARGVRSAVALCVMGTCAFYGASWFFDKLELSVGAFTAEFLEELVETLAAVMMVCAAFAPPIMVRAAAGREPAQ